ncbi:MAG: Holliday junction branch migration DNA helicase RuvB, partial [Dehalococcoidia bacterium]
MPEARIISGEIQDADLTLDTALRPRRIDEFIGQEKIKENLSISIAAAQQRQEPL